MTTPAEYNRKRIESGAITPQDVADLTLFYQGQKKLVEDGMLGPATLAHLAAQRAAPVLSDAPSEWGLKILAVAIEEIGNGEEYADNCGEDLHRYRDFPYGDDFKRPIGHWCAFFTGYVIEEAAKRIGKPAPRWRRFYDDKRNRRMPIGSALVLAARVAEYGGKPVYENGSYVRTPIPGDIWAIKRGRRGSRAGHVGIIESFGEGNVAHTIEGNAGAFPSMVKRYVRDFDFFDLATIARL